MSKPSAPSMPTARQIEDAYKAVASVHRGARIARVGPEGITFEYPDATTGHSDWQGRPFTADAS